MKVIFMGTPDFSVPVLEALATHHEVICVYTQPPRQAGRGNKLLASPVQQTAERLNIPVRTPVSLRKEDAIKEFSLTPTFSVGFIKNISKEDYNFYMRKRAKRP